MLPSTGPLRRRWKTWEAALLHFGFTPDQVAERLASTNAPRDATPTGTRLRGCRWPSSRLCSGERSRELDGDAVQRLVAAYRALPQRSRYVLTARYGLRVAVATPLALVLAPATARAVPPAAQGR